MTEWFTETLHDGVAQALTMDEVVFRERTEHQDLVIFDNRLFGRVLALDGVVQLTTGDEFVYHEMLAHVPLLAHGRAARVGIVGGGDGGTLRRVLEHASVGEAVLVEIDGSVIELSRRWLPSLGGSAFDDPRTRVVIADGARYLAEGGAGRFDVLIIDSTDPIGPGAVLFTAAFYTACRRSLAPGGVLVVQGGVPAVQPDELPMITGNLRAAGFADVTAYTAVVPTYYGGIMTLGWASDDPTLRQATPAVLAERAAAAGIGGRYWTPEVQAASFALPPWIAEQIAG